MNHSTAATYWHEYLRGWRLVVSVLLFACLIAVAMGERSGWPFLAAPLERQLSEMLQRHVRLSNNVYANVSDSNVALTTPFSIRFIGGFHLHAPQLEIAAPSWSETPHMLLARNVGLEFRYIDLWRFYRGQPLRVQRLQADTLDAYIERLADGRASWQFGQSPSAASQPIPKFGFLQVTHGTVQYRDVPLDSEIEARLALTGPVASNLQSRDLPPSESFSKADSVLQVNATGQYRDQPLKIELISSGALPWAIDENASNPSTTSNAVPTSVPLSLNATVGRANLIFKGRARDVLHLANLTGRFSLKGPSLAAVGEPLGVTLPTTYPFRTDGFLVKEGNVWRVVIEDATVGASRLNGAFSYDRGRSVPLVSGRLGGTRLLLVDLGPAVGMSPTAPASVAALTPPTVTTATSKATSNKNQHKVLPARPFDLVALRAMDANVLVDIAEVDLNSRFLEPLHPLHVHLQLNDGVLTLRDLDARTARGQLMGDLSLDGRQSIALWNANLRLSGVRLEHWIHQTRAKGLPPFVSGQMNGHATLQGQGRSTAEILASLKGRIHSELRDGTVSHLIVEAAGLDLAQGLGVLAKGDDALPVQCGVADMVAEGGVLRPHVMVLDTPDSALWIDGSLSLATEALDLRVVVMPKDFSPLTLRAPLRVRGTFGNPDVSLEKRTMGLKLGSAFLLGLMNPLAALIPLIDPGDADAATRGAAGCRGLMQRSTVKNIVRGSTRTAATGVP